MSDANWDDRNTDIFCNLWIQQSQLGNCDRGIMNTAGYRGIVRDFYKKDWSEAYSQLVSEPHKLSQKIMCCLFIPG